MVPSFAVTGIDETNRFSKEHETRIKFDHKIQMNVIAIVFNFNQSFDPYQKNYSLKYALWKS